jgi:hypothetical protein
LSVNAVTEVPAPARFQALDAARALAILHMIWFHVHRWCAPAASIQRWPLSVDWWSLAVLSAPPLFFLCFGCALGMMSWESDRFRLTRRLLGRALELCCWYKLLFVFELYSLGAPSGAYWPALTYGSTSEWVEVLDFYCLSLVTVPWLLPYFLRLPLPAQWLLLALTWKAGATIQGWPYTAENQMAHAFLAGASGQRPFPYLFWLPVVLIGASLGRCWRDQPQRWSSQCLVHALLLVVGVGYLGEGGFSLHDLNQNIILNAWKHPPHLAYVGLTTANALFWLWLCTRLYGMQPQASAELVGLRAALARIGRHPLTFYCGQFLCLFWANSWLHFFAKVQHETSLLLATLAILACFPLARWLEARPHWLPLRRPGLKPMLAMVLPLLMWLGWRYAPRVGPLTGPEFSDLAVRLSEAGGDFDSDNWVSNETAYLHVLDRLRKEVPPGRVYVGVGPEQNFSYIAALKPSLAFTIDIRPENQLQHLFYKALFEISETPQAWLSNLTGRRLPDTAVNLPFSEWIAQLEKLPRDETLVQQVRQEVSRRLPGYGLREKPEDWATLIKMHEVFCQNALDIRFTFIRFSPGTVHADFKEILLGQDLHGNYANFLSNNDSYRLIRQMQKENRIIPLVGDFGGTQAIAALAAEMRRRNLLLGVFYLSNVEDYLMMRGLPDDPMEQFVVNLEGLPHDHRSLLVRTHRFDMQRAQPYTHGDHLFIPRVQRLGLFVWRYQSGQLHIYSECMQEDMLPLETQIDSSAGPEE